MTAYDSENEISIHIRDLPGNVRAFSLCGQNGRIVVLNSALTDKAMKKSYLHELTHFDRDDHANEEYQEYL